MGWRYIEHSDMCGCERCAINYEREVPSRIYDRVEDPDILDCGCEAYYGCTCNDYDDYLDDDDE